jgi:hydrogenase maturation protease
MSLTPARCLILACGNTLRGDDGVGPWLAEWAENRFCAETAVRVLSRQQWTPELAEDIAYAESVLFIDCSAETAQGSVQLVSVQPATGARGLATHHLDAAELLSLAYEFFASLPVQADLITIGAGSTELGEKFSNAVTAALPAARNLIEETVSRLLHEIKPVH